MSNIKIIDKYEPRSFSALSMDSGVVLCDSKTGAFLTLRYKEDLERLKELLDKIDVIEVYETPN
jgi:hypothetical protein